MADKLIKWLIKRLIFLWDRHSDEMAFSFSRDERTDYSVLVERYYDTYYTVGTAMYPYPGGAKAVNFVKDIIVLDKMDESEGENDG